MSVRAVVVDDEPLARRRLRRLLDEHDDVEVVAEAATGEEALAAALEHRPDLLFMDVRMPGQDGLASLRTLREKVPGDVMPLIVFITAYEEHAVEAFALDGTDYLVKPVDREQLARALRRVRRQMWRRGRQEEPRAQPGDATAGQPSAGGAGYLAAHRAGKIIRLDIDRIACVTVEETITWAHTPDGRLRLKQTLADLEERLPTPPFFRVSRSAVVNLDWIDHLAPMFSGTYSAFLREPMRMEVHVSRRRARELRELLGW